MGITAAVVVGGLMIGSSIYEANQANKAAKASEQAAQDQQNQEQQMISQQQQEQEQQKTQLQNTQVQNSQLEAEQKTADKIGGANSTILTSGQGVTGVPVTGGKTLLGN